MASLRSRIRGGLTICEVENLPAAQFLTLRLATSVATEVVYVDLDGPGHAPPYLCVRPSIVMKLKVIVAIVCLLVLIAYLSVYAFVRNKQYQVSYYTGKPNYTLLYDEYKTHWVFLYAFYPVIYLDRKLLGHATEIVDESRYETWTNR